MKGILAKTLIFVINIVLWACGIILIVFGGLALGDPTATISLLNLIDGVSNVTNIMNILPLFEGMAIFMIVLGSLLFLFGGIGCCGAFRMHKRMIMNYWIMLILGVLCEIALIIYGAVYPPTVNTYIQQTLTTSLQQKFAPVNIIGPVIMLSPDTTAAAWELLQAQSHCCGALDHQDYSNFYWQDRGTENSVLYQNGTLPPSCCTNTLSSGQNLTNTIQFNDLTQCQQINPSYFYNQGCWFNVVSMVWQFDYIAIIIASCLMATQLIGIGLSVHVWHNMVKEDGGI